MEEPVLPEGFQSSSNSPFAYGQMPLIPPILVARMRRSSHGQRENHGL
jgi:hypothetical protein